MGYERESQYVQIRCRGDRRVVDVQDQECVQQGDVRREVARFERRSRAPQIAAEVVVIEDEERREEEHRSCDRCLATRRSPTYEDGGSVAVPH